MVTATELGIPIPGFSSALSYYDGLRTERLPAGNGVGLDSSLFLKDDLISSKQRTAERRVSNWAAADP